MPRVFATAMVLVLMAAGHAVQAQSVQALVSASTIGTEEAVTYSVEVSGADFGSIVAPTPPNASGLQVVARNPSQSTSVSWVNGNVTRTMTFSWQYRPLAEGPARIAEAAVEIDGTTYATAAVTVTVVPQSERPARPRRRRSIFDPFPDPVADDPPQEIAERDVFIRATPSTITPFVNEQVIISYELFFREGMQPRNSRLADSWDAEGFWREDLPVEGRPMPRSSIENGLRYNSILVKRVAVFPTRSGSLTVDPLRIATEVFSPGAFGFGNSLFSRRTPYQEIRRSSLPVAMEVKPLPAGAPDGYRDAVGRYSMEVSLSGSDVEIGEPLELVIRIAGEGNISTLEGPPVVVPGAFEAYDPETNTNSEATATRAGGSKFFTYVMIPRANGEYTIGPLRFSYLNPATAEYRVLERALPAIRVRGTAPATLLPSTLASGFPVDDIAAPLAAARWEAYPAVPLHQRWWMYAALAAPLILLAALAYWRRRTTRMQTDVAWARGRRAHPMARRHLKQALRLHRTDAGRPLFVELERAVLSFVGNRMNVAELGMTRPQLDVALADAGVSEEVRTMLQDFLAACDAARFAPEEPDRAAMDKAVRTAGELIALIDGSMRA